MKQSLFEGELFELFSKLDINQPYILDGFHLDFFLSLYRGLGVPAFVLFPDRLFDRLIKYLSVLHGDRLVIVVPPQGENINTPKGFLQDKIFHTKRSQGILSSGLDSVSFILCAESGFSFPIVSASSNDELNFSSDVGFNDCVDFFSVHSYRSVDVVFSPGDFCLRGGIVDVYPFSETDPVRISFLDDVVVVRKFDVQTQLSTAKVENFIISAPEKRGLLPLSGCSLSRFLFLYYNPDGNMETKIARPVGFSSVFTHISFEEFVARGGSTLANIHVDDTLSSSGVGCANDIFIPRWFINEPLIDSVFPDENVSVPLNITTITRGDYLVHRDHGVGIYMGLRGYNNKDGSIQEFLSLKYEDGGEIRLDIGNLSLVDYYASADADGVALDSLQKGAAWSRKRRAAHRRAEETIEYLMNLYVRRKEGSRPPFIPFYDMEYQFLNDFAYKDTADQTSAWKEISDDLSSSVPMDRLLCGDVGFGKTEIALRAAFRVVLGGRRVLVLAPTTILANQLYVSFHSRLGAHAVSVEIVSRFRSSGQIMDVQEKILSEKNDVLIGTHSVLNNDIYLKNIGLLVVDEEHRFGVKQKEEIKRFKESVDVLSMSATPIPRSLNLALSGIYSISLLQTPPLMRLPIITRIEYLSDQMLYEAISFEVERGGQVYFVHNDIKSIQHITGRLRVLLPKIRIMFIHGKEPPRDVEKKMGLFVSMDVQVLICTSIIEAGIDVPNANCIIINNSHLFGLSQLYQIRGRVGRGHCQAYAYLLIPRGISLSTMAFGRIKTIEENTRLGSGYNISRADMDLRGSGSLFGYKQSGGSGSVGYEMYVRLIQRALHESGTLKSDFVVLPEDVLIAVFEPRHIPEDYISIEGLRLSFYKSFSSAIDEDEIDDVLFHLTNRFGPPPLPVKNLVLESKLRVLSAAAGVLSIQVRGCGVVCKIVQNDNKEFVSSVLGYIEVFFCDQGVDFHVLPFPDAGLSLCIHFSQKTDKYSLLSLFLDKLKALV